MSEQIGALSDITVLDLTRVLAGPYCAMMLADMGANVIKIEVPGRGDDTRGYPPIRNGESMYYANVNRNKKGITLNLKLTKGKAIFKELVKKADIVLENYRPGVMDKLGLGYDELKKINPRIIYAEISGFGSYGPYSQRPGYDILSQAMGGLMSITGQPGNPPTRAGSAMGDILGGLNCAIGILAALHARSLTGEGQKVDVALVDSVVAATENTALRYFVSGKIPERIGNRYQPIAPYDSYPTKNGDIIVACGNQKLWEIFCNEILHQPELIKEPLFIDAPTRTQHHKELRIIIESFLKDKDARETVDLLLSHGIPSGPIMNIEQIVSDEHIAGAREMFIPLEHPVIGPMKVNGTPIKLMGTPQVIDKPAPTLGRDNEEIIGGLGYSSDELKIMKSEGVV